MTRIAEIADRLHRLAKRREDEGIYTDAALCEEAAAYLSAALAHPLPLKEEVERVLGEAHEFIETSAFNAPTKDYFDAVLKDIDALLSRIRAGAQEGWRL